VARPVPRSRRETARPPLLSRRLSRLQLALQPAPLERRLQALLALFAAILCLKQVRSVMVAPFATSVAALSVTLATVWAAACKARQAQQLRLRTAARRLISPRHPRLRLMFPHRQLRQMFLHRQLRLMLPLHRRPRLMLQLMLQLTSLSTLALQLMLQRMFRLMLDRQLTIPQLLHQLAPTVAIKFSTVAKSATAVYCAVWIVRAPRPLFLISNRYLVALCAEMALWMPARRATAVFSARSALVLSMVSQMGKRHLDAT